MKYLRFFRSRRMYQSVASNDAEAYQAFFDESLHDDGTSLYRIDGDSDLEVIALSLCKLRRDKQHVDYMLIPPEVFTAGDWAVLPDPLTDKGLGLRHADERHCLVDIVNAESAKRLVDLLRDGNYSPGRMAVPQLRTIAAAGRRPEFSSDEWSMLPPWLF